MKRIMLAAIALGTLLAGCPSADLTALTVPPPGSTAALDNDHGKIRISRGVALAFECTTAKGQPCTGAVARSDDASIADVRPGFLDALSADYYRGPQPAAVTVVIGRGVGQTQVRVADRVVDVEVLPR